MNRNPQPRADGFTFVEMLFGLALIVACSVLLIAQLAVRYHADTEDRNRVFAFSVARSLLTEAQAFAASGRDVTALDDRREANPILTLAGGRGESGDGNFKVGDEWVWTRRLRVKPVPGVDNRALHAITVQVAKRDAEGNRSVIATLSTTVASPLAGHPATQTFDLYLLAIENIPGVGVEMDAIRPYTEAVVADLERANPGLEIRTHWITKASYGRDRAYTPEVAAAGQGKHAYSYPSDSSGAPSAYTYDPTGIRGRVHVDGAVHNGRDPNQNPLPYALADGHNHAMRLPEERAFHRARLQEIRQRKQAMELAAREGAPRLPPLTDMSEEPTLRLLLEDLSSRPERHRNALILNLHGRALPMPALRNYSDAAADPTGLPHLRCVTHPEELRTQRATLGKNAAPAVFRVYAYSEKPTDLPEDGIVPPSHAVTLRVMGMDLTDPARLGVLRPGVQLDNLVGGVPVRPPGRQRILRDYRPFAPAKDAFQHRGKNEMFYHAQFIDPGFGEEKYTLVWLFNTPVTAPAIRNSGRRPKASRIPVPRSPAAAEAEEPLAAVPPASSSSPPPLVLEPDPAAGQVQGLSTARNARLYGLDYIPSPTGTRADFGHDLASPGDGPKNTARWRLRIGGEVFAARCFVNAQGSRFEPAGDVRLEVRTAFWQVGGFEPDPNRVSTTYTWWAARPDAVPMTERYQFLGDPRHNPYRDLAHGDPDFGDGYNWFFDGLRNGGDGTAGYPALDPTRLANGWLGGHRCDAPRFLAVLRQGLLRSHAAFASLGGFGDARILIGGERRGREVETVRQNQETDAWWERSWLGELYPDQGYAHHWNALGVGNLPTGAALKLFRTASAAEALAASGAGLTTGTVLVPDRTGPDWSWEAFFNASAGPYALGFESGGSGARLTAAGEALQRNFRIPLPKALAIDGRLAWRETPSAPEWGTDVYRQQRCGAQVLRSYWDIVGTRDFDGHDEREGTGDFDGQPRPMGETAASFRPPSENQPSTAPSSALVQLIRGEDRARIAVHRFESEPIGFRLRHCIAVLLDAALAQGEGLPPRVRFVAPSGAAAPVRTPSLDLSWELLPGAWNGVVSFDPDPQAELLDESAFCYALSWSRDLGHTWRSLEDGTVLRPGDRPQATHLRLDQQPGPERMTWNIDPRHVPAGRILLRVEVLPKSGGPRVSDHVREVELVR